MASRRAERWKRAAFCSGRNGADRAVRLPVGLEPLEDRLAVVQADGRRVERERAVGREPGVVPAAVRRSSGAVTMWSVKNRPKPGVGQELGARASAAGARARQSVRAQ